MKMAKSTLSLVLVSVLVMSQFDTETTTKDSKSIASHNTKMWFYHLREAMALAIGNGAASDLLHQLTSLKDELQVLRKLCGTDIQRQLEEGSDIHIQLSQMYNYGPCGVIQMDGRVADEYSVWYITVHNIFSVVIHFLKFYLGDSGVDCPESALTLEERNQSGWTTNDGWIFCGYRQPWVVMSWWSHRIKVILFLVNQWSDIDILFLYSTAEITDALGFMDNSHAAKIFVDHFKPLFVYDVQPNMGNTSFTRRWLISASPGHQLFILYYFILRIFGELSIYDGSEDIFLLYSVPINENIKHYINLTTEYYQALVVLHVPVLILKKPGITREFEFQFYRQRKSTNLLPLNSTHTLLHSHRLLNVVYELRASKGKFPDLSFTVRTFYGYNHGGCSFGGFIIRQNSFRHRKDNQDFGPFCHGSALRYISKILLLH